jgi:hypothetical protein
MPQRSAIVSNRANASLNFIIRLMQEANLAGVDRSFESSIVTWKIVFTCRQNWQPHDDHHQHRRGACDVVRSEHWFPICNAVPGKKFSALQN